MDHSPRAQAIVDPSPTAIIGVVVIGRNEGDRLSRCLASVLVAARQVVYVDSGSTDSSVAVAHAMNSVVVQLDMSVPFTAARARNAGFARLREIAPTLSKVQFVDGDCELIEGWLESAADFLDQRLDVGIVFGRLRERHPQHSVYNLLCEMEWDRPPGEASASGGIAMMRVGMFAELGGFCPDLVSCEEYELCLRARELGWKVWSLSAPMAWHDAAMFRFGQWWTRTKRTGFGHAHTAALHHSTRESQRTAQLLRPWFWAGLVPLLVVLSCIAWGPAGLALLLVYPLQVVRTMTSQRGALRARLARAYFLTLGKFPELAGQLQYWTTRRASAAARSFDYKS